ncbi:MAG: tripartite tricarboxylate transporter substrate binding protein [Betaproteobacteria bacterium]|nr:tripartite tricarboxylate transporter substrate binding protein [Betaproteobacteria bacterium]
MTDKLNLAAILVLALAPACAMAQAFPAKPLRLVVASSPGSGVDILARLVAPKLAEALGQQVLIDNRAGAGGNLGAAFAARAAPDGYTAFMATPAHAISGSAPVNKTGYDFVRDFAPVSLLTTGHYMLVVHPSVPAHNVKELIALARARTGQLNYASAGNGNATHLAGELFNLMAGVKTVHVPYKGGGHARTELLGGQVDFMFHNITAVLGDVRERRLRALAVTGPKRALAAPEIATVDESGLRGYDITSWFGVMLPAAAPAETVARLHRDFAKSLQLADIREKLAALGSEAVGSTPAEFARHLRVEHEKWGTLIRKTGLQID